MTVFSRWINSDRLPVVRFRRFLLGSLFFWRRPRCCGFCNRQLGDGSNRQLQRSHTF